MTHSSNDEMTIAVELGTHPLTAAEMIRQQTSHLESGEVRAALEKTHGKRSVWNHEEFAKKFAVSYFDPPLVHVIRRRDKKRGAVYFTDSPRFYFSFNAESNDNDNRTS